MKMTELKQNWTLSWKPAGEKQFGKPIPAQVPGNVLGDLHRAGIIDDPYFADNSVRLRDWEFADWEYATTFDKPQVREHETLQLVFEGIDTIAEISVNGTVVGHADNMFIAFRFTLDPALLRDKENRLTVRIQSPINAMRGGKIPPVCIGNPYNVEAFRIRKAKHTYGWDIAPRLVGAGLWRKVSLEVLPGERWTDLYAACFSADKKQAEMYISWNFTSFRPALTGYSGEVVLTCRDSVIRKEFPVYFESGSLELKLENPYLWFPAGCGEQNLYRIEFKLYYKGELVDTKSFRTALRQIDLVRDEVLDPGGKGNFVFVVNGRRVFIKGSNWVPVDDLHGENHERMEKALELFCDLGCNMIRSWGGGVYEDHDFFDFCDEHGLMVWQDFCSACEILPPDDEFQKQLAKEAEAVVLKLRNHPSLALWCGDNECDLVFTWHKHLKKLRPSDNKSTRKTLPDIVHAFDPVRDFLPSSPYVADELFKEHREDRMPEQHLWGPRDTWKGHFYLHNTAVFASEIGYHGMTAVESMKKFLSPEALNDRHGKEWNCHAAQPFGDMDGVYSYRNTLMENQTKEFFGAIPADLEMFAKESQIVQAEATKSLIELFRSKKWNKTGLIWWNVIDGWPQFSDAVVDYYFNRKLAYYYIRHAQQPISMVITDPEAWECRLIVSNDTDEPSAGTCKVTDLETGELFFEGEYEIGANDAAEVAPFRVFQSEKRMLLIEWNDGKTTCYNHFLLGKAPFDTDKYAKWLDLLDKKIYHFGGQLSRLQSDR